MWRGGGGGGYRSTEGKRGVASWIHIELRIASLHQVAHKGYASIIEVKPMLVGCWSSFDLMTNWCCSKEALPGRDGRQRACP